MGPKRNNALMAEHTVGECGMGRVKNNAQNLIHITQSFCYIQFTFGAPCYTFVYFAEE